MEALAVYLLVLTAHALRKRFGLAHFYALLGGLTAIMSWVTDAGVKVEIGGLTFMVGSTVFYTSLLLGVFVVYVFDGSRPTRIAISTVAGVSAMVPVIAMVLHYQMRLTGHPMLAYVPMPGLRINVASVLATVADLIFLAMAWEFMGKPGWRMPLWLRSFLTLLGVMCLDVLLFSTGAFAGRPEYFQIFKGTLLSRIVIAVFAGPLLYGYLRWQNRRNGAEMEQRPILAILTEMVNIRAELSVAQQEIARRKAVEAEKELLIQRLEEALAMVKKMEGLLPVCSSCRRIRVSSDNPAEAEQWMSLEAYLKKTRVVRFSHGMCMDCLRKLYPEEADALAVERRRAAEGRGGGDDAVRR